MSMQGLNPVWVLPKNRRIRKTEEQTTKNSTAGQVNLQKSNMPSSSTAAHKKRKLNDEKYNIPTQNQFETLSSHEEDEDMGDTQVGKHIVTTQTIEADSAENSQADTNTVETCKNQTSRKTKIPPITVTSQVTDYTAFKKSISDLIGENTFKTHFTSEGVRIFTNNLNDYDTIKKSLLENKILFFAYAVNKPKHLVIKGLPKMEDKLIQNELNEKVTCTRVVKLKQKSEDYDPIYMATFDGTVNLNEVRKITAVQAVKVKWEKYKRSKGTTQCYRCQVFGHGTDSCNNPPRCVKCREQHLTSACKKEATEKAYCVNCTGEHRANSKICPTYLRRLQDIQTRRDSITSKKTQHPVFHKTEKHFPQAQWIESEAPKVNYWHQHQQRRQQNATKKESSESGVEQIEEFQQLLQELEKFNKLCNVREMLNLLKTTNEKLEIAQGATDKLQIISEMCKDDALRAHK